MKNGIASQRPARILLLDDEADVVEQCALALKKQYLIVKTNSCFEAIAFMDAGREMIDLVICDYHMPGMNGVEFVDQIRKLKIRTPVVLCTGVTGDQLDLGQEKFTKVLRKPFGVSELREVVANSLALKHKVSESYRKFHGALIPLRLSMAELQKYLEQRGLANPAENDPESVLKRFGRGDDFRVYMAWHYLHEFCAKIPTDGRAA
ncbi:MAG: response regulator [Bdellovibrionota bacterium]